MEITLESIAFNHPSFETTGAFDIRRNETEPVVLPEWEKDRCTTPDCSPVAYAIDCVPETITIKASFSATDIPTDKVYIKAIEDHGDYPRWVHAPNILSNTEECLVHFKGGQAKEVSFTFPSDRIVQSGASASDHTWRWQFSTDSKNWTDFQTTQHRVYTVPRMPTCPWEPRSGVTSNIQAPWTEALEYACHWASGVTKDLDLASEMVTKRVYSLGKVLLRWEQSAKYAHGKFNLTQFLALFRDGIGGGQTLNCDDCAAIVSTFANVLGADLWQSSMGGDAFSTNPILLIGDSHWTSVTFSHHSVAWKGACTENDELFDACLQIDGDRQPDRPPQLPKQPVGIRFGTGSDGKYQSSLFKGGKCRPIPNDPHYGRQRRKFGSGFFGDHAIQSATNFDRLKNRYQFDTWPPYVPHLSVAAAPYTPEFFAHQLVFENRQYHMPELFRTGKLANAFQTILKPDQPLPTRLVGLNIYECADGIDPNEILLRVLSCFESFLERSNDPSLGDLAFADGSGSAIVFRRGRVIGVIRSVGRQRFNVVPVAMILNRLL